MQGKGAGSKQQNQLSEEEKQKQQEKLRKKEQAKKESREKYQKFEAYVRSSAFEIVEQPLKRENDGKSIGNQSKEKMMDNEHKGDIDNFCENSLVVIEKTQQRLITVYIPAYLRCHFRNMTEMDIQNLSCSFVATMNLTFYLGSYEKSNNPKDKEKEKAAKQFAQVLSDLICENLKVTFQNDFVLNIQDDMSTNVSDSDRTVRKQFNEYETNGVCRRYITFIITREFKFGLRSDILFFPLEQNDLDLITTLNSIKTNLGQKQVILRFNCMNIELRNQEKIRQNRLNLGKIENKQLQMQIHDLYMQEHDGQQITADILEQQFKKQKNNAFFRNVKISFPLRANSTEFGYYKLIEDQIGIHYTRAKQSRVEDSFYEKLKNCLFCRKKIVNYNEYPGNQHPKLPQNKEIEDQHNEQQNKQSSRHGYQQIDTEERSMEDSYCNAIMHIPMLKSSLGTIIQLCIPIFFLSFLGLVEFLYSSSTSGDQVRGQKIGSSTLIVATYISFIYAMRTVIPPTPSWSFFEVAVCILAASSLLPIIESIYAGNYQSTDNPFEVANGLFIAAFIINAALCTIIILMIIIIKIYTRVVTRRRQLNNVTMDDLLHSLTKKHFYLWRNVDCESFMRNQMKSTDEREAKSKRVYFQRWHKKDASHIDH